MYVCMYMYVYIKQDYNRKRTFICTYMSKTMLSDCVYLYLSLSNNQ
jgi:hypothetical protein